MSSRSLAALALLVLAGGGGAAIALGAGRSDDASSASQASAKSTASGRSAARRTSNAATTPAAPSTAIPGEYLYGLAQDPAGGFLTSTINFTPPGRLSAALTHVPTAGGKAITTSIVRRPTGSARISSALSAVSPVGAVAAVSRRPSGPASKSTEVVTIVRADGHRVSEQTVPGLPRGASPYVLAMGPTGAVALASTQPAGRGTKVTFSFRPAGASRFNAPVTLPGASVPSADGTENSDLIGSELSLEMAPDGGAVIIDGPGSSLQRVTAAGAVGEPHRLDPAGYADVTIAAFRDDSTLVAASTRAIEGKAKTIDNDPYSSQISIAEWAPGAAAPSVRHLPLHPGEVAANDDFTLTLGPEGRTTLALANGEHQLEVLSGTGTAIESIGTVAAEGAYDAHAFPTADGGTALLWVHDGSNDPLMTATAPPGAAFGAPRPIRVAGQDGVDIQATSALPGGRVAIAYTGASGDEHLVVVQP